MNFSPYLINKLNFCSISGSFLIKSKLSAKSFNNERTVVQAWQADVPKNTKLVLSSFAIFLNYLQPI